MKKISEFIYLFFMCCNLVSVIGFSVKLGIGNRPVNVQWGFAIFAVLTGIAFLAMFKTYLKELHFDSED